MKLQNESKCLMSTVPPVPTAACLPLAGGGMAVNDPSSPGGRWEAGLRIKDIDRGRMVLSFKAAKGKKDRCVMLSETPLDTKSLYGEAYRPKDGLEEGQNYDPYSVRSLQKIFQNAKFAASIRKELSFHSRRHPFATHVSNRTIQKVQSPLDALMNEKKANKSADEWESVVTLKATVQILNDSNKWTDKKPTLRQN